MNFGEKVKKMRQLNALSQCQLAEKIEVTLRTVRGWEQEGRVPKQTQVYKNLAAIFGCSVNYLLSDSCTDPFDPCHQPAEFTPSQILATTKTLFSEHKISKQKQHEFIQEIEHIYLTSWEEVP